MLIADIRTHLEQKFTAIYGEFFVLCGQNREAAIMLGNLFGWSEWVDNHKPKSQGWITKSAEEFAKLGFTRHSYEKARDFLLNLGVIEYKRAGVFGRMAWRICREKLFELIYTRVRGIEQPEFNSQFHTDKDGYHIPKFIPLKLWNNYLSMRQNKKPSQKPLDAKQKAVLVEQLSKLNDLGFDLKQIITKSLISGWAGFYRPDKSEKNTSVAVQSSAAEYEQFLKEKQSEQQPKTEPEPKPPKDLNIGKMVLASIKKKSWWNE